MRWASRPQAPPHPTNADAPPGTLWVVGGSPPYFIRWFHSLSGGFTHVGRIGSDRWDRSDH